MSEVAGVLTFGPVDLYGPCDLWLFSAQIGRVAIYWYRKGCYDWTPDLFDGPTMFGLGPLVIDWETE